MKRLIAIVLTICLLSCLFIVLTSASDLNSAEWVTQCTSDNVAFLRSLDSEELIGRMMKNDILYTTSSKASTWYKGHPGPYTNIYKKYGYILGYAQSVYFSTNSIQTINNAKQ